MAVVAIVCLTIGSFAGARIPRQEESQPPASQEPVATEPDYNALLSQVKVVNVKFTYDYDSDSSRIFVMPGTVPEGLEMKLLIENINSPDVASVTKTCTFDGNYFTTLLGDSIIPGMEYRFTGVFCLGDAQVQIPLVLYHRDQEYNSYGYTHLWEE